jgi:hypothetical protein
MPCAKVGYNDVWSSSYCGASAYGRPGAATLRRMSRRKFQFGTAGFEMKLKQANPRLFAGKGLIGAKSPSVPVPCRGYHLAKGVPCVGVWRDENRSTVLWPVSPEQGTARRNSIGGRANRAARSEHAQGLLQDRDMSVGATPECTEGLVRRVRASDVAVEGTCARMLKLA